MKDLLTDFFDRIEEEKKSNKPTGKPLGSRSIHVIPQVEEFDINWDSGAIEHYEPFEPVEEEPEEYLAEETQEVLSEYITEPEEEQVDPLIRESLLSISAAVKNSDPLTPLGRKFSNIDELAGDYRLFKNRVQTQLGTLGGGGAVWLKDLDDVDLRSQPVSDGDILVYDSTSGKWVPETPANGNGTLGIDDLDDVNTTTVPPEDGDFLVFDSISGNWVPGQLPDYVESVNGSSGVVTLDAADVGADPAGTAAGLVSAHESALDPHSQYTTTAEASAAAPVQSVNGETGAVSLSAADVGADPAGTAASAISAHESDTTPHSTITNITKLGFNSNPGITVADYEMAWNNADLTLDLGLPGGVTLQVGQESLIKILNKTGSTLLNGKVVYITGAQGNRLTAAYADADQATAEKTIAVLTQNILNNQEGFATVHGLVRDIDTSAYSEGQELFLSTTAGNITGTRPTPPNHAISIGYCVRSHATVGSIFVTVHVGSDLPHLHDVNLTSLSDNQVLTYDAGTSTWINEANNNHTHSPSAITFTEATANASTYSVSAAADYVAVTYDGATTISLPVSPTLGHKVTIKDEDGTASLYPITIQPGVGSSYNNIDKKSSITIAINYGAATLLCTTNGWRLV
jgi:hypothetical protein